MSFTQVGSPVRGGPAMISRASVSSATVRQNAAQRGSSARALQEFLGLQRRELVGFVGEPDLGHSAPQRLTLVHPEGDSGIDKVLPDLRDLARVLHRVHVHPIPLEFLLTHPWTRGREGKHSAHSRAVMGGAVFWSVVTGRMPGLAVARGCRA